MTFEEIRLPNNLKPLFGLLISLIFIGSYGGVRADDTISVAIDREYAPYEFVAKDGSAQGFTPNLLREIGKAVGVDIEFHPMAWPEAVEGLQSGTIDIINMIETPEREQIYAFAKPHSTIDQAIFRNSEHNEIQDLNTLSGHVVAFQANDISLENLSFRSDIEKVIVNSKIEGMLLLNVGKVDAFLTTTHGGVRIIQEFDFQNIELATTGIFSRPFAFAAQKNRIDLIKMLNSGLGRLETSGRLKALHDEWLLSRIVKRTWLETHVSLISGVGSSLLAMMVVILLLALNKRKRAEIALRTSEARFKDFAESASDWFWEMDADLRFTYLSPRYYEISGYTPEEKCGTVRTQFVASSDLEQNVVKWAMHDKDVKNRRPYKNFEFRHMGKDGKFTDVRVSGVPFYSADGTFLGYRGTGTDITDQVQAEKQMIVAKEEAEKANLAKSQFLASMSHELRTPLNAVLGFAQMLQYDPQIAKLPTQKRHAENIIEGGEHLLQLVNQILDLAKIEAYQLDLFLEEVDANEIIANCTSLMAPVGKTSDIQIIDKISGRPSVYLYTDPMRFKQALVNLLSNAIKYNKKGGTVTIDGEEIDGGFFRVSVADTGIGIAEKDYDNMFQMFHRLGADPMITKDGTGIGLTVTKMLVERMAGKVDFKSEEGIGSTFWIQLPLSTNTEMMIWSDAMKTGVEPIDKDHQILISLLNKFIGQPLSDSALEQNIKELLEFSEAHFRREEKIMEVCKDPDLEQQRNLHRQLFADLTNQIAKWRDNSNPEFREEFHVFLKSWLLNHILEHDIKIAPNAKGKEREIGIALKNEGLSHPLMG